MERDDAGDNTYKTIDDLTGLKTLPELQIDLPIGAYVSLERPAEEIYARMKQGFYNVCEFLSNTIGRLA